MRKTTRPFTKTSSAVVLLALLATLLVTRNTTSASSLRQEKTELSYFSATVIMGPDKGLAMKGKMQLQVEPSGAFTGQLVRTTGGPLTVSGQVTGNAFHVAIRLGGGKVIFGTGTSLGDFARGHGAAGGNFVGPSTFDLGSWGTCFGPRTSDGSCYGIYVE